MQASTVIPDRDAVACAGSEGIQYDSLFLRQDNTSAGNSSSSFLLYFDRKENTGILPFVLSFPGYFLSPSHTHVLITVATSQKVFVTIVFFSLGSYFGQNLVIHTSSLRAQRENRPLPWRGFKTVGILCQSGDQPHRGL